MVDTRGDGQEVVLDAVADGGPADLHGLLGVRCGGAHDGPERPGHAGDLLVVLGQKLFDFHAHG